MTYDLFDGGSQCFGWAFQTVSLFHLKLQRQLEEYSLRRHAFSKIWHINKMQVVVLNPGCGVCFGCLFIGWVVALVTGYSSC